MHKYGKWKNMINNLKHANFYTIQEHYFKNYYSQIIQIRMHPLKIKRSNNKKKEQTKSDISFSSSQGVVFEILNINYKFKGYSIMIAYCNFITMFKDNLELIQNT